MIKKFGVGVLIICFGLSNVNRGFATEVVNVAPVIVQPYEIQELNQQVIGIDRQNRDEEIAIKGLIEDNDKLTQSTLARQQDEGLAKIDQTMLSYRDALVSRDNARIVANGQRAWSSRYGDLITLTEDADDMTVHQDLESKSGLLTQKFQMLSALKDEMTALNEKLKGEQDDRLNQKQATIDSFKKIAQDQQDKIQMLVSRLSDMDQKIARLDDIIAQQDQKIAQLKVNLSDAQNGNSRKDDTIKDLQNQIALLQDQAKTISSRENQAQEQAKDLEAKDEIIKNQANQLQLISDQVKNVTAEEELLKKKADQLASRPVQVKDQDVKINKPQIVEIPPVVVQPEAVKPQEQQPVDTHFQAEVADLKNQLSQQALDLKAKNDSLHWLNEILAATKNKAEYYKLTSLQENASLQQVKKDVQNIKDDFAQRFKDFDKFDTAISSLKDQVGQLSAQLAQKQQQVDALKGQLEDKATQLNQQSQQDGKIEGDLKAQLQDKVDQISKMKSDILAILQDRAAKEIYAHNVSLQLDDRIKLAKQLIDLQQQEETLLDEKNKLALEQSDIFEQRFGTFEQRMKGLLADHQIQAMDLKNRMEELQNNLAQKQEEVDSLKQQMEAKIVEQKNLDQLERQIQDLKTQLQDKANQMAVMKTAIQSGREAGAQVDALKQQLADEQNRANTLKQELDSKIAQSDQMTLMMGTYQKKLEGKDNAYNEELRQVLGAQNEHLRMEGQVAVLKAQLQTKQEEIVKIKKDMSELQEISNAKDLSLSLMQQKLTDEKANDLQGKIKELQAISNKQAGEIRGLKTDLAISRQQLGAMPSSDELEFLRSGLKNATVQLNQKNAMLSQLKANADLYAKEYKSQTQEFKSLKVQLQNAFDEISRKTEDLKYKDLELIRFKAQTRVNEIDLRKQLKSLTHQLDLTNKKHKGLNHENTILALENLLKHANQRVQDLQQKLKQYTSQSKTDPVQEKLKQALDKIDEQGLLINELAQKLQDAGQTVDLTKMTGK